MNFWVWFAQVNGLGPVQKKILLEKIGNPEEIFKTRIDTIEKIKGISKSGLEGLKNNRDYNLLRKYEDYIQNHNIKIINIIDDNYPAALKETYNPPITLFAKGDVSILNQKSIAIVGCRDASIYGIDAGYKMAYGLSKENIVIVSGLARGIDTAGHCGALEAEGKTIAVLGCGVDICYPFENFDLYKRIVQKGLIVSEFIVGTKPSPEHFPMRNRIVSGLSNGVLVVEAKKKSGSLITADLALEQGREVYVIPGNINSKRSEGTNELLKQGAKLVTCVQDIIEDLT